MSMNTWTIMGRITKPLEIKETNSGTHVLNFTLAVDDDYKPKDGSDRHVDFVDCVIFNGGADTIAKWCDKGSQLVVSGRGTSEKWQDKDGNNRTSWRLYVRDFWFSGGKSQVGAGTSTTTDYAEVDDPELPF